MSIDAELLGDGRFWTPDTYRLDSHKKLLYNLSTTERMWRTCWAVAVEHGPGANGTPGTIWEKEEPSAPSPFTRHNPAVEAAVGQPQTLEAT